MPRLAGLQFQSAKGSLRIDGYTPDNWRSTQWLPNDGLV